MQKYAASPLERRVVRLERTNRLLVLIGVGAGSFFLLAQTFPRLAPGVLRAERFELVEPDGDVRAALRIAEDGAPSLVLLDDSGAVRASLVHDEEETALYIHDDHGKVRVGMAQFANGGGGLALHGAESRGSAVLYMADGRGRLTFYDVEGKVVGELPGARPPSRARRSP